MQRAIRVYRRPHWALVLLLPVTLIAFWPRYLMQLDDSPWQVHFHGVTGLAWFLLLIAQSVLATRRRFDLHRRVGRLSYGLAPLLVFGGFAVLYVMAGRLQSEALAPFWQTFGYRLAFIDFVGTLHFSLAVVMALRLKRNVALHSRWMLSSVVPLLYAVFSRLYDFESFWLVTDAALVTAEVIVAALIFHDWRKGGISAPWVVALAVLLLQHLLFRPIGEFAPWLAIVDGYWRLIAGA